VRVQLEFLVPGMEDAEEADLGTEMGGIARDLQQGFGAGPEQQTVDEFPVLESQCSQLRRQGEDDVDIGRGQQFTTTRRDPAFARTRLTLGAVPVATAVVGDPPMAAVFASLDMTAKGCRAAMLDRRHDLEMLEAQVAGMGGPISGAGGTEDIGDLERGAHRLSRRVRSLRP